MTERETQGYDASWGDSSEGVIDAHDGVANVVSFTNYHREGGLIVSKNVEGRGADFSRPFGFEACFTTADGSPLKGVYPLVVKDSSGEETGSTTMLELKGEENERVQFEAQRRPACGVFGLAGRHGVSDTRKRR